MTPVKVTFQSGHFLMVYSDDPDSFLKTFSEKPVPEIKTIEYDRDAKESTAKLQEVTITLNSGGVIVGMLPEGDIAKALVLDEIHDCTRSRNLVYAKLMQDEVDLDARLLVVKNVSNNIPCIITREYVHQEYIRRKRAYVAALEAVIDGVMRRPTE